MSHFAKVYNGIVQNVIRAEQEFIDTYRDGLPGKWIQCSYNTYGGVHFDADTGEISDDQMKALRYNFPSIGWNYNIIWDAFYPPQPFPSWTLNRDTYLWDPPVDKPDATSSWDEENQQWVPMES